MKDIYKLLESKKFIEHLTNRPQRKFLGDVIFPSKKVDSLNIEYIKGSNSNPVMAKVTAYGREAALMGRDGITSISGKIPAIKVKRSLGEENMLKLYAAKKLGGNIPNEIIQKSFDDITATFDAVSNKIEYLRMQALCKGVLDFTNDGYQYTIDYLMPAENKPTVATLWDDETNSNPELDIQTWMTLILEKGGTKPQKAVTSINVLNHMLRNQNLRKAIFGVNSDRLLTLKDLNSYFLAKGFPVITTYDLRARDLDGNTVRFFDEDKFVLLPGTGIAGKTIQAPTVESISINPSIKKAKTLSGITVVQYETLDPVDLWTKASGAQLPTMPDIDFTISATVL